MRSYNVSEFPDSVEKHGQGASETGLFSGRETLAGEGVEAKKRMFNLPNRNLVENKETLDEQTGTKLKIRPEIQAQHIDYK